MITVDTERVNAIITDDTEKVRYIDYISELSQALGLTEHTVPNDVAWYPSHLPAPRPMQKKQARKEWHQEALECGYYTNSGTPYATSKSLLEQLKYRLENTTAYRHGQGGADYQYLYDTIINNPLHRVFTGQPIGRFNSTAVVFYDFLRTIGCLTIADARTRPPPLRIFCLQLCSLTSLIPTGGVTALERGMESLG